MIGNRIELARKAQGLSMQALAGQVGVSADTIKKFEHNKSMPSSDVLLRLLNSLQVPLDFLFSPIDIELENVEYRKKSTTSKTLLKQIELDATIQAERWITLKELWSGFPIKYSPFDFDNEIKTLDDIENIANQLREHWQLGTNAIPNMIELLETHGIIIIVSKVDIGHKIDGLQFLINEQPVIVISSHWTGDRQRFTLAHELGHLILHHHIPKNINIEKACNRFAGAFLLPKSQIFSELGEKRHKINIKELELLKQEYGLSMQAILYRAKDLQIITENTHQDISKIFSRNNWRKKEPGVSYPKEQTHSFEQLVYYALAEQIISESKAAELLNISVFELQQSRNLNTGA